MSLSSIQNRKPYERAAYATLKPVDDLGGEGELAAPAPTIPVTDSAATDYFAQEAGKLEQLRAALWQAFQSGPAIGIPVVLVDLTIAYTNALRLELSLLGCPRPNPSTTNGNRGLPVVLRAKS